mgnify:CR=1 FL=1
MSRLSVHQKKPRPQRNAVDQPEYEYEPPSARGIEPSTAAAAVGRHKAMLAPLSPCPSLTLPHPL